MKKRFREVSELEDVDTSNPPLSPAQVDEAEVEPVSQPSTFLSRMMAKSQKLEEEEGEKKKTFFAKKKKKKKLLTKTTENDGVEALINQVPMYNSGRSSMLASLRGSDREPGSALDAVAESLVPSSSVLAAPEPSDPAAMPNSADLKRHEDKGHDAAVPSLKEELAVEKHEAIAVAAAAVEEDEDKYLAAAEEDEDGVPKIELFCMCQKPWNPNHFMVACDECNEWYHDSCLGIPQEDLEKMDKFMCNWCVEKGKRQEQRRKQWEADKAAKAAAKKARQAARKRELQTLAKRVRSKPCKNSACANRSRPNSK